MAVIQWALNQIVNPRKTPCGTVGAFTVIATVAAQTGRGGASYVVRVKDSDAPFGPDLLDSTVITRIPGPGWAIRQHTFSLDCTPQCIVKGAKGSSNEQTAEIYCEAEEVGAALVFARIITTANAAVTCEKCTEKVEESGSSGEGSESSDQGGAQSAARGRVPGVSLAWSRGKRPVEDVEVCLPGEVPELQVFPDEIDFKVRSLQIGQTGEQLGGRLKVAWSLPAGTARRITQLDGRFVRYDPSSCAWQIVDRFKLEGRTLSFTTDCGGLFGVAAGGSYRTFDGFESRVFTKDETAPKQRRKPTAKRGQKR